MYDKTQDLPTAMVEGSTPTALVELLDIQETTFHLVSVLAERLQAVRQVGPEADRAATPHAIHILKAVEDQYRINHLIRDVIDSLVV